MQDSRESSVFRGLANVIGDGLAFGAGVKLAQAARKGGPAASAPRGAIETAIDDAVSAKIGAGFESLREEVSSMHLEFAKTLGGLLAEHVAKEVGERRDKDLAHLRKEVDERGEKDLAQLRGEIVQTHREFADAVGRIVTGQIETKLKDLSVEIERRIDEQAAAVRGEVVRVHENFAESMTAFLAEQVESQVLARVSSIQQALSAQIESTVAAAMKEESASIRKETAGAHAAMSDFLSAVGSACRDAAVRASQPAPQEPQSADSPRGPELSPLKKTGELLRIPLVSSLVVGVTGLLMAYYF